MRPRDRSHKARTVDDVRAAIFCSNHLLRAASRAELDWRCCLPQLAADLIYKFIPKEIFEAADLGREYYSVAAFSIIRSPEGPNIAVNDGGLV